MAASVNRPDRARRPATPVAGWHFVDETLRDGRPVPADGVALRHDGAVAICASGLHASERILDALKYASGNIVCRVECDDVESRQEDKLVCRSRTVLWRVDGESLLRDFARRVALDVAALWDVPEVVRKFLETGNENLRVAARAAARQASRDHASANEIAAAMAGESARAAAARTHPARATALAAAWAASKASADAGAWDRYDALLERMVEEARQQGGEVDEWADVEAETALG